MADQPNVFSSEETPQNVPASTNVFEDHLKQIKNETGEQKYDSVPKALEALQHSQSFIGQLKEESSAKDAELQALREEVAKRAAVEDVVSKFTATQEQQQQSNPQVQGLDEQKVAEIFNNLTAQQSAAQAAQSNEVKVNQALVQQFGDKAGEAVQAKAAELGMSVQALQQLSQSSPNAALSLFQVAPTASPSVTTGSYTIPASQPRETELKRPEKSLLRGASTNDQIEYLRQIRESVYKKHGVQS
jgi:hypothetical protein